MASRTEAGLDHARPIVKKWTDGVAHHFGACEQFLQLRGRIAGFSDLVIRGFNTGHVTQHLLDLASIAASRQKRNVVFSKEFRDQAS